MNVEDMVAGQERCPLRLHAPLYVQVGQETRLLRRRVLTCPGLSGFTTMLDSLPVENANPTRRSRVMRVEQRSGS